MSPDVGTYLSKKDYERLKLKAMMRNMTLYRYAKQAILHALEQIEKQGLDYLLEDDAKKKKKSWMTQMPIIDLTIETNLNICSVDEPKNE